MTDSAKYKYEHISDYLTGLMNKGRYLPGDKLPSVRQLCNQFNVSQSTILTVYALLENQGLVEIRPQAGCYVSHEKAFNIALPAKSKPNVQSQWIDLNEILMNTTASGLDPKIVPFGVVAPDPQLIPYKELNRILANLCRTTGPELAYYDFAPGNAEFRAEMARRSRYWGCDLEADDFVATSGTLEALNIAFKAVCKPGDVVAIESPAFYCILQILGTLGLQALEIPTDPETGMDLNILEANIVKQKVKAVALIPNFNNPMGYVMPDSHKQQLVDITSKHGIPIIEDDVYGDLNYGPIRPKPIKAFDKSDLVILCSSFSKALIPGYRTGWCVPGQFIDKAKRYKWMSSAANTSLPQLAVAEFLRRGSYEKHLRRIRKTLTHNIQIISQCIEDYFPDDVKMTRPAGGYTLWMEFSPRLDSVELYQKALQQKISITPGPAFSVDGKYKNFIRLNYGFPWTDTAEKALKTLGKLAKSLS